MDAELAEPGLPKPGRFRLLPALPGTSGVPGWRPLSHADTGAADAFADVGRGCDGA